MITLARYVNEDILPYIGNGNPKDKTFILPSGVYDVKMRGTRLECFKRSQSCVWCRMTGTVWLLQKHERGIPKVQTFCFLEECPWCALHPQPKQVEAPHLNLYAQDRAGNLILMTQDHILARSRGGSNKLDNLATMCCRCNQAKGSDLIDEFDARGHRVTPTVDGGSSILPGLPEVQSSAA